MSKNVPFLIIRGDEHDNLENNEKNLLLFVEDFKKEVARRFNRKYNEL